MKKLLLLLALALGVMDGSAQKKVVIWEGTPFRPGAWDAAAMRFSDDAGQFRDINGNIGNLPYLSDEVYWGFKTLIFDISEADNCFGRVMNGWWSARYDGEQDVQFTNGPWSLQLTEEIARDCARGNGGMGKDLDLMVTSGSCIINSVYYIDDQIFLQAEVDNCTERLDSIVSPGNSKEVNTYDDQDRRTSYTYYGWDANGAAWIPSHRFDYSYDKQDGQELVTAVYSNRDNAQNSWVASSKNVHGYDVSGRETLLAKYTWDKTSGSWMGTIKTVSAYDDHGLQTLSASYSWDTSTQDWRCTSKYEYAFDEYGHATLEASYRWDNTRNALRGSSKREYGYVGDSWMTTLSAYYEWDDTAWDWRGTSKTEYAYDDQGFQSYYTLSQWDDSAWDWTISVRRKFEYIFDDETAQLVTSNTYSWDLRLNDWLVSGKQEYSYNEKGERTGCIEYVWSTITNAWVYVSKEEYAYDEAGNRILEIDYTWSDIYGDWSGSSKYEQAYDTFGNRILDAVYNWDSNYSKWIGNYKSEYEYDENGNMTYSCFSWEWDTNHWDWVDGSKYYSTYDEAGHMLSYTSWGWVYNYYNTPYTQEYLPTWKYEYAYDANGNQTISAYYEWSVYISDWIGRRKTESAYDAMCNETLHIDFSWDYDQKAFVNTEKWEKTFDTMGNETTCNKYLWNRDTQDWNLTFVSSSEYDTSVSGENVLGIDTRSKLLNESQTTMSDGIILSQKSSTYYYSPMSGSAISQIRTDAPVECIIDLYGQKVRQMESGKIYIRGNAKVMMR